MQGGNGLSLFRDLWWFFRQEKKRYLLGVFFLLLVSLFNLIPPYAVGQVIDQIQLRSLTVSELLWWCGLILLTLVSTYILRYWWRMMIFGSAYLLGTQLRNQLYHHFTKLSPRFYQQRRIGDLMAHATNDITAVQNTAGEGVLTLVDSLLTGGFVILMMLYIDWRLALVVLLPMPFMAWATNYYGTLLHQHFYQAQAAFSDLNDKVQENVSGVRVIKAFGQEEAEKQSFAQLSAEVVDKNIAVAKVDSLYDPTINLIVGISFFLSVAVGAVFVVQDSLTIGQLTSFTMYLGYLIWPMLAFGWLFNIIERGRASYDRIAALLAEKQEITDAPDADHSIPSGDVYVAIRSFTYPEGSGPALQDVEFTLKQGETVGVVGKTGSGKTTLLRLLLREFDVTEGTLTIGGQSIYRYSLHALRGAIGYVPQDHFLFSTTIAENIAFGKPEATRDEIISAAKIAQVHDDIMQFANGYETLVGERGVTLSGGQKQRIAIARAIILDPEILILDDALSAVDAKTEAAILRALQENRQGKTTLIATHRLSAVEHAHEIIVLADGRIAERGTHLHLLTQEGWYQTMYRSQQLELLVAKGGRETHE